MAQASSAGSLAALNGSFRRTLRAEDKSERTVKSYTEAVGLFADFLGERGHPLTVEAITRDDVRAFIADQLDRWKPLTALNRYRGLQAFFKWAVAEGEMDASPMAGMNPPHIPDEPPPVLTDDELRRLLKSCEGRDFTDRRDAAILRLFLDTGVRVAEAAGIMLPGDLAAFLMPRDSVLSQVPLNPSVPYILKAKRIWKVAAIALAHRLHEVGLSTEWHYRMTCVELGKRGYRGAEPSGIPRETSQVLSKVFHAMRNEGITPRIIARDLHLNVDDLNDLVFGLVVTAIQGDGNRSSTDRPRLSVV